METPVGARRRLRRRETKLPELPSPRQTSTPITNRRRSVSEVCIGGSGRRGDLRRSPGSDVNDDTVVLPLTQNMVDPKTGVYWNYEASPSVKAELRRLMAENDDDDEDDEGLLPSPKPITPVVKIRAGRRLHRSPVATMSDEAAEIFESMKEIGAKIQAELQRDNSCRLETTTTTSSTTSTASLPRPSPDASKAEDGFDGSDDDSMLIRCTQEAEAREFRRPALKPLSDAAAAFRGKPGSIASSGYSSLEPPSVASVKKPAKGGGDLFDDDSFDQLLSQMEIPTTKGQTGGVLKSSRSLPRKLFGQPGEKPSGTSWRRVKSNPEATTTSGALLLPLRSTDEAAKQRHPTGGPPAKCTREEIEKKRLEALRRRQASQQRRPKSASGDFVFKKGRQAD